VGLHNRFIGINVKMEARVNAETGETISVYKPWWAKLVIGEDNLEE